MRKIIIKKTAPAMNVKAKRAKSNLVDAYSILFKTKEVNYEKTSRHIRQSVFEEAKGR